MVWVDYIILGVIAISALIGLVRGLIREVVSLGIWALAIAVAWFFYRPVADQLQPWINNPSLRLGAAVLLLILVVLILGAIVAYVLALLVEKTGLTGTDRVLGLVFGAARGAVIMALVVFLATLTPLTQDPWWQQSLLLGHFERLALQLLSLVPPEILEQVRSL